MYEELSQEFSNLLGDLHNLKEPETQEELSLQLSKIAAAMEKCEKLLLYVATSSVHKDDVITYLFEYKQLLRLEQTLSKKGATLPSSKKVEAPPAKKPWWKLF
jgi:hypothetical protein